MSEQSGQEQEQAIDPLEPAPGPPRPEEAVADAEHEQPGEPHSV